MIPLYGFMHGDTLGLLILSCETDTAADLARKLQQSARARVKNLPEVDVIHKGKRISSTTTVAQAGITALDRFDVVPAGGASDGAGSP